MKAIPCVCAFALSALRPGFVSAETYPPLPALDIDVSQTSVSGLSSGGFMAVQLGVAYSSIVKGVGVVAGGPYYCAQGSIAIATTQCSCTIQPASLCAVTPTSADVPALVAKTKAFAASRLIDDAANIGGQRVIMISGASDATVPRPVVKQLGDYYAALGVPEQSRTEIDRDKTGHTMPTANYGVACSKSESPFIGKCRFDAAKEMLGWIYGPAPLAAPATTQATQTHFLRFDQTRYLPADRPASFAWTTGMDASGWLYVPAACKTGTRCRLHVALHGCEQGQDYLPLDSPPGGGLFFGETFVRDAGYARWAETNRIVVLFPQAVSIPGLNPNGCWDWWGYTGSHFADHRGVQMRAIRNMIDRLVSGASQ
ncbi:extracellular catalytic domain type 2 short-chain-length polyhydroxyalkanoate depolymerase [Caballeronia telluris]|uniref:Polyhydroxybutyrate depolymerase n=1 Tax=Caballeronia telluris TaxID=326475 RepID=A0A158H0N8_9BURK|nr:poly(3-hydroxybutyrate) depolymerase [Caballeronia telluris]SAL37677.1 polyhydroxybutyrate depolymerase [Caballeronia telluris]